MKSLLATAALAACLAAPALAQQVPNVGAPMIPSAALSSGGGGTVTSVAVSGGTTGLATSGGPITGAGTITIAGTLAATNGGTGLTALGTNVPTALGLTLNGSGALVATTNPGLLGTIGIGSALISGPSAGQLDFGGPDAASPVAQTIQFQGVVTGTLNGAGPAATLNLPISTGSGAGGTLSLMASIAGASGSGLNTRVRVFDYGFSSANTFTFFRQMNTAAIFSSGLVSANLLKTAPFTVATLPSAGTSGPGARAYISDGAASPVYGAVATGGGSLGLSVFSDGITWRNG